MSKPCNRCGKPIVWGCREQRGEGGKRVWVPLDPEPTGLGIVELRADRTAAFVGASLDPDVKRYVPHEATCTAANQHIRKREIVK